MMGCFDTSGSEQQSQSQSYLGSQAELMNQAIAGFQAQGRVGSGATPYEGQRVAGMDPATLGAIEGAQGLTNQFTDQNIPMFGEATGAIGDIISGKSSIPQLDIGQANQAFTESRQLPAEQGFDRFTAPLAREEFAGPNFQSSARAEAVSLEGERLTDKLRGERSGFLSENEAINRQIQQQNIANRLSATGQAGVFGQIPTQIAGQKLAGLGGIAEMGGIQQRQQQAEINAQMAQFQESLSFMDPQDLEIMMGLLGMQFSSSQGSADQWGEGLGYSAANSLIGAWAQGTFNPA